MCFLFRGFWDGFFVEQSFNKKTQCLVCRCHISYIREGYMTVWDVQSPDIDTYDAFFHLLMLLYSIMLWNRKTRVFFFWWDILYKDTYDTSHICGYTWESWKTENKELDNVPHIPGWLAVFYLVSMVNYVLYAACTFTYIGRYIFTCTYVYQAPSLKRHDGLFALGFGQDFTNKKLDSSCSFY